MKERTKAILEELKTTDRGRQSTLKFIGRSLRKFAVKSTELKPWSGDFSKPNVTLRMTAKGLGKGASAAILTRCEEHGGIHPEFRHWANLAVLHDLYVFGSCLASTSYALKPLLKWWAVYSMPEVYGVMRSHSLFSNLKLAGSKAFKELYKAPLNNYDLADRVVECLTTPHLLEPCEDVQEDEKVEMGGIHQFITEAAKHAINADKKKYMTNSEAMKKIAGESV